MCCAYLQGEGYFNDWDRIMHPGPGRLVPWRADIKLKKSMWVWETTAQPKLMPVDSPNIVIGEHIYNVGQNELQVKMISS